MTIETRSSRKDKDAGQPPWRALAHRWFVQYNPLYLVSAALVLTGVYLTSEGLARDQGFGSELLLTGITELYQAGLIGGAALLYRLGQRRPAVMLALIEVVYLGDLTLQTAVAPFMELVGPLVSSVWLVLFLIKLRQPGAGADAQLVDGSSQQAKRGGKEARLRGGKQQ